MKKSILVLAISLFLGIVFTSCKEEKKEAALEETKTEVEEVQEVQEITATDMAMNVKYQCSMDCEKGKTYDKPGKCPVCKMDMKKVEKEEEGDAPHDESEAHEH